MTAAEKMARARARLLLSRPWWASLLLHLKYVEGTIYGTMETDGVHLFYEPSWVDSLPLDEVEGVICHEVAHCVLHHVTRRGHRDPALWNWAADECVNAMLAADGIRLPAGSVSPGPLDETVEDRYEKLRRSGKAPGKARSDLVAPGSGTPQKGEGTPQKGEGTGRPAGAVTGLSDRQIEAMWKQAAQQARGLLPGALSRKVDGAQEPRERWQEQLARFVSSYVKSPDRTWSRSSRRLPGLVPGNARQPETRVAIVLDTSGSVDGPLLEQFTSEARSILAVQGITAHVMSADAAVQTVVEPGEPFPEYLGGGGGTDFRPALSHCERLDDVAAVVYFTDGAGTFPSGCSKPVLWALSQQASVPFGESINLYQ